MNKDPFYHLRKVIRNENKIISMIRDEIINKHESEHNKKRKMVKIGDLKDLAKLKDSNAP